MSNELGMCVEPEFTALWLLWKCHPGLWQPFWSNLVHMSTGLGSKSILIARLWIKHKGPWINFNLLLPSLRGETPSYFLERNPPCLCIINSISWNCFYFCLKLMLLTCHGRKKAHHTPLCPSWLSSESLSFSFSFK